MNPEIKKEWVGALRSGEYKQCTGMLYNAEDNTFCCLGVLCDIAEKHGIGSWRTYGDSSGPATFDVDSKGFPEGGVLPPIVTDWAELGANPKVYDINYAMSRALSVINDQGASFEEIANAIEKSL